VHPPAADLTRYDGSGSRARVGGLGEGRVTGEEREDRWPRELVVADELVPRLGARSSQPPACCWRREGGSPALHAHRLPPVPPWVGQCSGGRGWQWGGRRRRSVVVEEKRTNRYLHN
jgi:hypothetical protein